MDHPFLQTIIEQVVQQVKEKNNAGMRVNEVPIAVSARHVHLSEQHVSQLFGENYQLTVKKYLSQPNQFAAEETVTIAGPRGAIERVRILGPARGQTQVEVSLTDAIKLGCNPPIRQSGNLVGSSPVTIIGTKGSLYLQEGLIIAQPHIHTNPSDAKAFGVSDGDYVSVGVDTIRPITFERVLVRVSSSYITEMHIDTDEANAGWIQTGQLGRLIVNRMHKQNPIHSPIIESVNDNKKLPVFGGKVLSEHDVQKHSGKAIAIQKSTIVTPLARETARNSGIKIEIIEA
ncbi:phosphate propanoyltransferase [Bacillus marasmi]|uniref:phosphate propanoyltransferase n=1 Tax=Bacillus marasmi TaxID=1926279 RepID=UPI0011CCADEB|nr:phosphate propanoyltransferase [Bacillus marasmi]